MHSNYYDLPQPNRQQDTWIGTSNGSNARATAQLRECIGESWRQWQSTNSRSIVHAIVVRQTATILKSTSTGTSTTAYPTKCNPADDLYTLKFIAVTWRLKFEYNLQAQVRKNSQNIRQVAGSCVQHWSHWSCVLARTALFAP